MTMRRTLVGALLAAVLGLPAVARAADTPVTFTKDVAPILYKSCVECHRPTMFAPMSLMMRTRTRGPMPGPSNSASSRG